jgi:hypothetical protein
MREEGGGRREEGGRRVDDPRIIFVGTIMGPCSSGRGWKGY